MATAIDQQEASTLSIRLRRVGNTDANDQARSLSAWSHHYTQLSVGAFSGGVDEFALGSTIVYREFLNRAVLQTGTTMPETILLGAIVAMEGNAFYNGTWFDQPVLLALPPGGAFEFRSPLAHEIVAASVKLGDFEAYASATEEAPAHRMLERLKAVSGNAIAAQKLAAIFRLAERASQQVLSAQQLALAEQEIRSGILACLVACCPAKEEPAGGASRVRASRIRVFRRADQYIREHAGEPIDIETLCRVANASRRTLQYCFEDVVNLGPLAYLRCVRLSGARDAIRAAPARERPIADIAADWGFWHQSNFAVYYKQMFGELPSETAARRIRLH